MPHYPHLIIGGGLAADAAARGIREIDAKVPIGLVSAEPDPPYARPPLSKALWKGEPLESIWKGTSDIPVKLHLGVTATALDAVNRRVTAGDGTTFTFEKLLLATGGAPRRLPFGGDDVIYFRTVADYHRLRALAGKGKRIAVIGGGFIGSEVAASLAMNGCQVTMFFPEEGIAARLFPADLARFLVDFFREKGVDVRPGEGVRGISRSAQGVTIDTTAGAKLIVDAVVAGIGITPSVDLAKSAGLKVGDGIIVDEHLRTSNPEIFAAGDVANFDAPALGHRMRVEHEDNSVTMGHAAGRAMAGDRTPFSHLPFFYSDLFDLGYEAVGEMDPLGMVREDWKVPFREGVVYFITAGRVRGVLLWNTWGQVEVARALIGKPAPPRFHITST